MRRRRQVLWLVRFRAWVIGLWGSDGVRLWYDGGDQRSGIVRVMSLICSIEAYMAEVRTLTSLNPLAVHKLDTHSYSYTGPLHRSLPQGILR